MIAKSSLGSVMQKEQGMGRRLPPAHPILSYTHSKKSSMNLKMSDNAHFFFSFLILTPLICCSFICCHGFQIEAVDEARTFSILQVNRESPGYGRQTGKNMAAMWSTSHGSASWTMFTYINCWLMHRLIQAKQCVQSTFFPAFVLCSTNF